MSTTFWIQLIGVFFGFIMLYFTFLKLKREEFNKFEFFIWIIGWAIFIIIAIIPTVFDPIINSLNFYRRLDFFVVIGFFALLGMEFYNYSIVKKNQKQIENLVRKIAINRYDQDKKINKR